MIGDPSSQAPGFDFTRARIGIVGSGAVGCYYGGRLAQHGADVHFLMRSDLEAVRARGLEVRSCDGSFHLSNVHAHGTPEEMGSCDVIIIAIKSTANASLLMLLPSLLKPHTLLLTLQNGLGSDDFLAQHFGAHRVLGGLCFVCINRTAPGVIEHLAQGHIALGEYAGPPQDRTQQLAAWMRSAGIRVSVEQSLALARWRKLVWNIPFNGLSIAAGEIDTAQILASPPLLALVREIMREVIAAATHLGHPLPDELVEKMVESTRVMAGYHPSSLIDYREGREVELDAIWGEPVCRARAAGYAMPRVEMLHQLLRALSAAAPRRSSGR
jgi:2-dehydropantoate 2-reductase